MAETFILSQEEMDNPQVMLWIDLIRTNSQTFRTIPPSESSLERAHQNARRAIAMVHLCGGFEAYWDRFHETDNLARFYQEKYKEDALTLAMAEFVIRTG